MENIDANEPRDPTRAHKATVEEAIEHALSSISPDAAFLLRGRELTRDKGRQLLRWVGERSHSRHIGLRLGGSNAATDRVWAKFAEPAYRQRLLAIGQRVADLVPKEAAGSPRATACDFTTGSRRLIDPENPVGWGLLRAVARSIHAHAAAMAAAQDEEEVNLHLGKCWAWDAHGVVHKYKQPWIVLMLLAQLVEAASADGFFEERAAEVECPVHYTDWREPGALFHSIHPCMHYLSKAALQALFERGLAERRQPRCPMCRERIQFARLWQPSA